ncbi:MAG: DUF4835 family protein [Bacteroidetes bacterium]|nr:MAG: DUF4835 family protein [Bacteroidota bacterium]
MKKNISYILFIFQTILTSAYAQELNCQITVVSQQIQGTQEKLIFDELQKALNEFVNNNKWTKDEFQPNEKIDCSMLINITKKNDIGDYEATIQVQARRPVYKSSYFTPTLNIMDENFHILYQQFTQLYFNYNNFQTNLTSVIAYYVNIILALDYDSFSLYGGTTYWNNAQIIASNAQSFGEKGWSPGEPGQKNRYWYVDNQLQASFQGIREFMYRYHRLGLDIMYEKPEEGRTNILKAMELLVKVYQARPASFNMQVLMNTKRDEIIKIFKEATPEEKQKALEILSTIDPANTSKYQAITGP